MAMNSVPAESPVLALGAFVTTVLVALDDPACALPLRSSDGNVMLDHVHAAAIREHAHIILRDAGDRIEMVLQPALQPSLLSHTHLSPLQRVLRHLAGLAEEGALATDGAGFFTALFHLLERELGLLLRTLYVLPAGPALTVVVPVFRPMNYPMSCVFDEEIPALALALALPVASKAVVVAVRAYDGDSTQWDLATPRIRQWVMPATWPAPRWVATSWVDPHCHLYPVCRDPAGSPGLAYHATHYWCLAERFE
jgi:hypothetical protein